MVTPQTLLQVLPAFKNKSRVIEDNQDVNDIINEVYDSHIAFSADYDRIYQFFDTGGIISICRSLFDFCKSYIPYKVETEADQTSRSPSAILSLGNGDCKHYATFIGGVLSAIARNTGRKINWVYRFANYDYFSDVPGHVFVVVTDGGRDLWIDPVLASFNQRLNPVSYIDDKIPDKMLTRISGIEKANIDPLADLLSHPGVSEILQGADLSTNVPSDLAIALKTLMAAGIMNQWGQVDTEKLGDLITSMPDATDLVNAVSVIQDYVSANKVGGWFDDAFKFIQHNAAILGMQVPRAAFLGLVRLNAFGYATKLDRALSYDDSHAKLADLWERAGGKFSELVNSIGIGVKKKAILTGIDGATGCNCSGVGCMNKNSIGCAETVSAAACLIVSAALIVSAIMPIITSLLKKHNDPAASIPSTGIDPATGLPIGTSTGGGILAWLQSNPIIVIAGVIVVGYLITQKKTA